MVSFTIVVFSDFAAHPQVFRTCAVHFLFKIFVVALLACVIHISSSVPYELGTLASPEGMKDRVQCHFTHAFVCSETFQHTCQHCFLTYSPRKLG